TKRGGARRTAAAILHGLAVARERNVEQNDSPFHAGAGGVELLEAPHGENISLDACGRRTDAVAKTQHHERPCLWREYFSAFLATHPVRNFDRLGVNVLEAVLLHLSDRPLDRLLQRTGAAQSMTEGVAEQRQPVPREEAGARLAADARGRA